LWDWGGEIVVVACQCFFFKKTQKLASWFIDRFSCGSSRVSPAELLF
jgi:hypothetical protein